MLDQPLVFKVGCMFAQTLGFMVGPTLASCWANNWVSWLGVLWHYGGQTIGFNGGTYIGFMLGQLLVF